VFALETRKHKPKAAALIAATTMLVVALGAIAPVLAQPQIALAGNGAHVLAVGKKYPAAVERWRSTIRRYGYHVKGKTPGWWQQQALAVVWAESGGDPKCRTGGCLGLFQINTSGHKGGAKLYKAAYNTKIAVSGYVNEGRRWRPAWSTARGLGLK
jgi:hypothetical protein